MRKGSSDGEASQFAKDLKWLLWNEVWFAVNSCRAWSYRGERHYKMLKRAAEDDKRSKEHLANAERKFACSNRTLKLIKALARSAGNEAARAVLTDGKLMHEFHNSSALQEEITHVQNEIGDKSWATLLQTLKALSAHVVSSLTGDKEQLASKHKDDFEHNCEGLRTIYIRAFSRGASAEEAMGAPKPRPTQVDAIELDAREHRLWDETDGAFVPKRTPDGAGRGRVSVVTPTVERRQGFHKILWYCFEAQTWPDKELIVVETYDKQPSEFLQKMALKEPHRLVYVAFQRPDEKDWSIGLKRNIGANLATGEFIANFDDDDMYAPSYLTTMVEHMKKTEALGVTLSSWYVFDTGTSTVGYSNPQLEANMRWMDNDVTSENVRKWVYGYGFSYVHYRQSVLDTPYDSINLGEDYKFFSELLSLHGEQCIALLEDKFGICLHTQHRANTARDYALWQVPPESVSDLDFADFYPVFDWYQRLCRQDQNKAARVNSERLFEFSFTRSAPRRYRDVTVHLPDNDIFRVRCTAGATCTELLEAVEEERPGFAKGARLFRLPTSTGITSPLERERRLLQAVQSVSPLAPLSVKLLEVPRERLPEPHQGLLARAMAPLVPQDRVGLRTVDLWLVWPDP